MERPANFGEENCCCKHCESNTTNGNKHVLNHGKWKSIKDLDKKELNRVPLPGDVDYKGD